MRTNADICSSSLLHDIASLDRSLHFMLLLVSVWTRVEYLNTLCTVWNYVVSLLLHSYFVIVMRRFLNQNLQYFVTVRPSVCLSAYLIVHVCTVVISRVDYNVFNCLLNIVYATTLIN